MRKPNLLLFPVLALLLAACTTLVRPGYSAELAELRAGAYTLDPAHSSLLFKVDHFGLSQYVGRFNEFTASLDFNPEQPADSRLQAIVRTNSIDVNNEGFEETLAGPDWFDSERFPQAVFETESVEAIAGNDWRFNGFLTLRGERAPVVVDVHFNGGAMNQLTGYYTVGFSAKATLQRSQFGIDSYSGLIGDTVTLEVHAEFQKQ